MMMSAQEIVERARETTGLNDFHSESFREGLEILVEDFDRSPLVSDQGRRKFEDLYVRMMANRLRIDDYIARHPEVLDEVVTSPVVVCGMPRTGTTLLSNLFGAAAADGHVVL
jgi:uncharacterized membrane protein YebE (DUF533 family)